MTILIADNETCISDAENVTSVSSLRQCELLMFKQEFQYLVLNIDGLNESVSQTIKCAKLYHPFIKIIFAYSDRSKDLPILQPETMAKLGIQGALNRPYTASMVHEKGAISQAPVDRSPGAPELLTISDMCRLTLKDVPYSNIAQFDYYVRINDQKFVRVFNKGDVMDSTQISRYIEKGGEFGLYYKSVDRIAYIHSLNEEFDKCLGRKSIPLPEKLKLARNLVERYVEEIYVAGISQDLVEEGKKASASIVQLIMSSGSLKTIVQNLQEYKRGRESHAFLVSFFSILLAKVMDWKSDRTTEVLVLGSMLHDVGMLDLPENIRHKAPQDMTVQELLVYKLHPEKGTAKLRDVDRIGEAILQMVYQHHERYDGSGFPSGISKNNIYPLAKILITADLFVDHLLKSRQPAFQALQDFITSAEQIKLHDPQVLKALLQVFKA